MKVATILEEEKREQQHKLITKRQRNSAEECETYKVLKNSQSKTSTDEIVCHLRKLGQPVTLFGEDHCDRERRLEKVGTEIEIDDGLQGTDAQNVLIKIQKEEREQNQIERLLRGRQRGERCHAEEVSSFEADDESSHRMMPTHRSYMAHKMSPRTKSLAVGTSKSSKNQEQSLDGKNGLEDQCLKSIQKWCKDWLQDLRSRPVEAAETASGKHAYHEYKTTIMAFQYLFDQLVSRTLPEDVRKGVWLMVQAMKERNYMHANAILLNAIAIGNSPWPVGVTQVGIHTKSAAREKISTTHLNKNAAAHIMGDEATRKYLHGLKRLLTVMQRIYPTDPSRSVEFHDESDITRGMQGSGSVKNALIEAEQRGDIIRPAYTRSLLKHDKDGTVMVPDRLAHILKRAIT
jgi:pre-mRNA-splicing factor 18